MPAIIANSQQRGLENAHSKSKSRLRNSSTGELLHLSGEGTTRDVHQSWLGHKHQAEILKQRALARGESWPFTLIPRAILDLKSKETANV
jgi:hypothetical protein